MVKLGAIYGLEQLSARSPNDHSAVVSLLSAYVRATSEKRRSDIGSPNLSSIEEINDLVDRGERPTIDTQAALTVLTRLPLRGDKRRAELEQAWLFGANLYEADLQFCSLRGAVLCCADMQKATTGFTDLMHADLRRVDLKEAGVYNSYLLFAKTEGWETEGAKFIGNDTDEVADFLKTMMENRN